MPNDIEKRNSSSWIISNDLANGIVYLEAENDSLRNDNKALREVIKELEKEKSNIIESALRSNRELAEQLVIQQTSRERIDEANENITDYWKRLGSGTRLTGSLLTDVRSLGNYQFEVQLQVPLTGKFYLLARPLFELDQKPKYLAGISYRFF